jgi:hypothetical protein
MIFRVSACFNRYCILCCLDALFRRFPALFKHPREFYTNCCSGLGRNNEVRRFLFLQFTIREISAEIPKTMKVLPLDFAFVGQAIHHRNISAKEHGVSSYARFSLNEREFSPASAQDQSHDSPPPGSTSRLASASLKSGESSDWI